LAAPDLDIRMRKFNAVVAAVLACALLPGHALAQGFSPAAQRVLAQARAASGGAGWNVLRGWRLTGQRDGMRYEAWFDPLRYGARIETHEPAGLHVHGFNGQADWQILPSGALTGADDHATLAQARTAVFLRVNGFFYPGRYMARGDYLGVRSSQGRSFDVLNLRPADGKPLELWFDRASHLLGRVIDRTGASAVTTELSDYRKVGPVLVAFHATIDPGDGARPLQDQVQSLVFIPADRNLFSLPPPPPKPAAAALAEPAHRSPPRGHEVLGHPRR
jgi:hypothetical protein